MTHIKISYKKNILTGILAGLCVDGGFNVPNYFTLELTLATLRRQTPDNPGTDIIGNKFYVTEITHEEIHD